MLQRDRRRHLLVAGTGRAGTSALVRYLTGLGLETHLSRHGDASGWDGAAQAGLEDMPLSAVTPDLPYVVKSPWSYQVVEQLLEDPAIALDGVVVPVRDLVEAAASRTVRQLQALHQEAHWMTQTVTTWEHWGAAPGGAVFSLNPIDQARLLAVGFHQLLERLVQADVPMLLLAFPRFVMDPDYLHRKLAPFLRIDTSVARAREVHSAVFKAANVRVGRELSGGNARLPVSDGLQYPTFQALDNAALKREVNRLRGQLSKEAAQRTALMETQNTFRDQLSSEVSHLRDQLKEAEAGSVALAQARDAVHGQLATEISRLRHQLKETEKQCAELVRARDTLHGALDTQVTQAAQAGLLLATVEGERDMCLDQLQRGQDEKNSLINDIRALRTSRSWRFTRPLRRLSSAAKTALRLQIG